MSLSDTLAIEGHLDFPREMVFSIVGFHAIFSRVEAYLRRAMLKALHRSVMINLPSGGG